MRQKNKKDSILKRIIIVVILVALSVFILIKAQNYLKEKTDEEINLIINNNNVTARLKHDVIVRDDVVYVSVDDIKNFFDKYIYLEDEINEIVTTYDKKIASIGFNVQKLTINGSTKKINANAIKENDEIYLPISEMSDVYNMEINKIDETGVITIDSLNREQIKAYTKSNVSVKWKKDIFSKTVDKVKKGGIVIVIKQDDEGWTQIRTEKGKIG